ncbi:MAG TPA: ABC transporter ATP-binding protein [Bacteroidetes bacterium]|nr:ABC transporter ATP-binding protein [Bacteroidota bacterium]
MEFLEVIRVSRSFGPVNALKEVSFSVNRGELFGLIGPDGAGKTTLFRIIASLFLPDEGKILVKGYNVVKDYKQVRRITGYMPGRFSLYHDLTVEENLSFYATVFGTTLKDSAAYIHRVYSPLKPFRKRLAGKLSGGMKQKLALSCALIHRPEFLLLDEPTTGVDAVSRKEFWEMLEELRNMGVTILVSTPYMDEAGQCDRVALIDHGKLLQTGSPAEIVHNFSAKLYAIRGRNLYALLGRLRMSPEVKYAFMFGREIHLVFYRVPGRPARWLENLSGSPQGTFSIEPLDPGMEDCFVELMGENHPVDGKENI